MNETNKTKTELILENMSLRIELADTKKLLANKQQAINQLMAIVCDAWEKLDKIKAGKS